MTLWLLGRSRVEGEGSLACSNWWLLCKQFPSLLESGQLVRHSSNFAVGTALIIDLFRGAWLSPFINYLMMRKGMWSLRIQYNS